MNPQIESAIFAGIISIIAGVVGYFFREYRQRAKPFLAITRVAGEVRAAEELVDLPDTIVDPLKKAVLINRLNPIQRLDEVQNATSQASILNDSHSDIRQLVDQALEAARGEDTLKAQSSLAALLSNNAFEICILTLIAGDRLKIPQVDEDVPSLIQTYPSQEHGGSIYIAFPGAAVNFGTGFTEQEILREKCRPFVRLIEVMDLEALHGVISAARAIIESELTLIKEVLPLLNDLLQDNSRWEIEVYLANLGKNAFLVSTQAHLRVQDDIGARYDEVCRLSLLDQDEEGERISRLVESPLIVKGESSTNFCYFTSSVQREMKRGAAFREAFVSGKAECWVEFQIEKVGLVRRKEVLTPRVEFTEMS